MKSGIQAPFHFREKGMHLDLHLHSSTIFGSKAESIFAASSLDVDEIF